MRDWKAWARAAAIRAIKTTAQAAAGYILSATVLSDVDWYVAFSAAIIAGLGSLLTSVAGLPEVDNGNG